MKEIVKQIEEKWDMRNCPVRVFTNEGAEIFAEDLEYLGTSSQLYISRGEEFDQMSQFSEYDILATLGEGGFGKVVLGEHSNTKDKVAIKIVKTGAISNAMDIDMIFKEAELLAQLKHTNIVRIINFYALKNMEVVFIMEYLDGGELLEYVLKQKLLPEMTAQHFFKQLTEGVAYCHREKMIHRDLKLENLLLTKESDPNNLPVLKIVDFGIAGICSNFDIDNVDAGTLKYMAPEQLQGKHKAVTQAVDIWAMGIILYAMLFGQLPFNGNGKRQILEGILETRIEYSSKIYCTLSMEVKDLLSQLLHLNPLERININDIQNHPWLTGDKLYPILLYSRVIKEEEVKKLVVKEAEKKNVKIQTSSGQKATAVNKYKYQSTFQSQAGKTYLNKKSEATGSKLKK